MCFYGDDPNIMLALGRRYCLKLKSKLSQLYLISFQMLSLSTLYLVGVSFVEP